MELGDLPNFVGLFIGNGIENRTEMLLLLVLAIAIANETSQPIPITYQNGDRMSRGLKLLGVCAWGYIKDNDLFVNPDPSKFNKVRYNSNKEIRRGDNVPLNGDHTHFLMVDDSARYKMLSGYTEFITR